MTKEELLAKYTTAETHFDVFVVALMNSKWTLAGAVLWTLAAVVFGAQIFGGK